MDWPRGSGAAVLRGGGMRRIYPPSTAVHMERRVEALQPRPTIGGDALTNL
jgi:hypothetical protein